MENINAIKFFIIIVIILLTIVLVLGNNLLRDYRVKEQQLNSVITQQAKENYELRVYKAKKEFSSKIINKLKNATKKN